MTTKKIVIAGFALLTIALLAGCETQGPETKEHENILRPPTGSMQTSFSLNQSQQAGVVDQVSGAEPLQTQQIPISEADQAAYQGALQLKDATFCDKITDESYKTQCKTGLADQVALAEALNKMDATICAKLSTKDKQDACKIQVDVVVKQKQNNLTQQKQWNDQLSLYNDMLNKKDYTNCDKLTEPSLQKSCRESGLVEEALATNDIKICDKGINDTEKQDCRISYTNISAKL